MEVWKAKNLKIYNGDFLKLETSLLKNTDLIVTSPPYNIGIEYGAFDDFKDYKDYLDFSRRWLAKSFEVLKDTGRLCINLPIDTGKGTKRSLAADITILAKQAGFKYKGTIIWNKQNVKNKYFLVFSSTIEVILIFYKKDWKPLNKEYREWINNIWQFSGESAKRVGHPAAFPVEIPRRLIKLFTNNGEIVLDPFLGGGTTLVASLLTGRRAVGVEISEKYFNLAFNRIINKKW